MKGNVLTVRIDMIEAAEEGALDAFAIFRNMKNLAKGAGASTLKIEGTVANEKLDALLRGRFGMKTINGVDTITIPIQ